MTRAYYNEIDRDAAQWIRDLIAAGLVPNGDVDERSIADVMPDDVAGYTQCHFFAGIAGWAYALRLAGWPDDRPVWTGSCPCGPFSIAGRRRGFKDPRHLWPEFRRLIAECRPTKIFGEQVARAPDWLRLVRSDLEALDYAMGTIPMEAASAGADHFRARYWFVADSDGSRKLQSQGDKSEFGGRPFDVCGIGDAVRDVADSTGKRRNRRQDTAWTAGRPSVENGGCFGNAVCDVVDLASLGWGKGWTEHEFRSRGFTAAVASFDDCQYLECPDGKWRRLPPPGVRWLGHGIPARVAKLRALGNAIDPRPAAQFIGAFMEVMA